MYLLKSLVLKQICSCEASIFLDSKSVFLYAELVESHGFS